MENLLILATTDGKIATGQGQDLPVEGDENQVITNGTKQESSAQGEGDTGPKSFMEQNGMLIWMGVLFIVMYMFMIRGPKKKQQQHTNMVKSLKKNDRVCTIGGIYGTVIEVREKEIVIKIDESNNTKMKVTPGAIRNVATEEREN